MKMKEDAMRSPGKDLSRRHASRRPTRLVLLSLLLLWGGMAHAGGLQPELQESIDGAVEKEM
jgi:hypothetical protein